ncbi:magnesium/cobalt transporter CorA [Candidatus Woesearchaeota archaeon]|nr:magnesium/cobalt transporter CorA [Candidatus Woesearchaeota archaeon]
MIELFYFDKKVKQGDIKEIASFSGKRIWLDVTGITKDEAEQIRTIFRLHPLTAEDLYNSHTRIKVEEFSDYIFCVFYCIQKSRSLELIELDLVLGKNFIISNHRRKISSIDELKNNTERLSSLFEKGCDFLMHRLIDEEIDNFFPVLETLDDQIEAIEERVTRRPRPELLTRILEIKRNIVTIKKTAFPQREKLSFLAKNEYHLITKKAVPYFRDIYDHAIRVSDSVDNYREAIGNTFDAYMSSVSNNMNEVMKVLSIIATIAIPLTVISGIYGTNFTVLPGAGWTYGFWAMVAAMLLLCLGMIYFFWKRRWF